MEFAKRPSVKSDIVLPAKFIPPPKKNASTMYIILFTSIFTPPLLNIVFIGIFNIYFKGIENKSN